MWRRQGRAGIKDRQNVARRGGPACGQEGPVRKDLGECEVWDVLEQSLVPRREQEPRFPQKPGALCVTLATYPSLRTA